MAFISLSKVRLRAKAAEIHWKSRRSKVRRALRRNRVLLVTLLAVGGLVALLTGISVAQGEWNNQLVGASPPPAPRFGAATAFVADKQEVLIFGGFVGTTSASNVGAVAGPPIVTGGDTWAYKSNWQLRSPLTKPSHRGYAAMAYDGARRNVVLFGGAPYRSNAVSGETWTWDPEARDWTLQKPPEPVPDPRQNAVMVYDPHRRVVMMFGGRGADGKPMNDTWTWNGAKWKIMPRDGAPSPRHSAAIAYDECNAEAVMFGGIGDPVSNFVPQPGETWTWNGAKWAQWTPQGASLSPPRRIGASMGYSSRSGGILLYGGLYTSDAGVPTAAVDHDVWRWHRAIATGWERMNADVTTAASAPCSVILLCGLITTAVWGVPYTVPAPRAYASFAYLGDFRGFSLFGGTPAADIEEVLPSQTKLLRPPAPQVALGDHYLFDEANEEVLGLLYGDWSTDTNSVGFVTDRNQDTPLTRLCRNPVPLPPADEDEIPIGLGAEADNQVTPREGVREIGRFPVLVGTDWLIAHRDTHINASTPNPNYKPAPDCPNRSTGGATSGNTENGSNTHLLTDQKRNRIYQFFICDSHRGRTPEGNTIPEVVKLLIAAYDGTTLKMLGSVSITPVRPPVNFLGALMHDVDRGQFLLRNSYYNYNSSTIVNELLVVQQDLIEKGVDPIVERLPFPPTMGPSTGSSSVNFFNHPKTGRAKVFFTVEGGGVTPGSPPTVTPGSPPAQSTPPKLGQWDLRDGRADWTVELPGCSSFTSDQWFPSAMRSGDRVYATCALANNRYAVVRIPVTEGANGSESAGPAEPPFAGPSFAVETWGVPKTERMYLAARTPGRTLWVFDGKVSRWVGRVGITSALEGMRLGFDSEISRLYVQLADNFIPSGNYFEQGGLLVVDTGLTPVGQPLKFPQFASPAAVPVASLPSGPGVPRRVFIRRAEGNMKKYPDGETVKFAKEMFYRVLADEVPVPEEAQLAQLDALTIPIAETSGKTEVSFDAEGSGYGIRLRSVGGIWTALRPFQQVIDGGIAPAEGFLHIIAGPAFPACVFPDRELMAGWVPQARLSDLDALARSSGLDVDSNSKVDLNGPFSRCNPTANASNFPPSIKVVFDTLWPLWQMVQLEANKAASSGTVEVGKDADGTTTRTDTQLGTLDLGEDKDERPTIKYDGPTSTSWNNYFKEVECVGDALATNTATVGNIYGSANCVQRQGLVEATARGSAPGVGPTSTTGFSVGEGYSTVTVTREPGGRGVVVTATAVATGIKLPGAPVPGAPGSLSIDRVETKAEAWSNGRPSDEPRASFTRTICGVHTPDYSIARCLTAAEQKQLVDNWNKGWGVNSKMYLPEYDPELYRGSPGGYIAGVIKPAAIEVEDQLFTKDYLREVPGLVIEFSKDSLANGPGRQVLQLAATRAVAGLGVQCNADLVYSPTSNDCVALNFDDDLGGFEDEEEFFDDAEDAEFEVDGEWTSVEAVATGESLGSKIGRLLNRLPVLSRLPIRQMGEALLGASVWLLLFTPLGLATRRFALMSLVARKV